VCTTHLSPLNCLSPCLPLPGCGPFLGTVKGGFCAFCATGQTGEFPGALEGVAHNPDQPLAFFRWSASVCTWVFQDGPGPFFTRVRSSWGRSTDCYQDPIVSHHPAYRKGPCPQSRFALSLGNCLPPVPPPIFSPRERSVRPFTPS